MSDTSSFQRLLAELKRRKVFRAAAIYGAGAFAVLQGVDIVVEALGLPHLVLTVVTVAVLVGFPVALLGAWAYERHPHGGLQRTGDADQEEIRRIVAQPRSVRWVPALLALAGIVLLATGVWLVMARLGPEGRAAASTSPVPGSANRDRAILVMPFAVQGSPDVAYLGQGMVSLLGTSLDGAGDLRAVDARSVIQVAERDGLAPGDAEAGAAAARSFGAPLYVVGNIVEAGGRLQVTAALFERDGSAKSIGSGRVEGPEAEMFEMVDDLTAQLLSGVSEGAAARVRRIAAVTTESLPALKAFLEGEEEFRRGQFGPSVESFRRAIDADSTFALAYYRLSLVAEWNLQDRLSRQMAEQAVRYADRLADRDRRLLEAFLMRRRGENRAAAEAYRSILGAHPDEMEAWLDLAEVQFHANPLYGHSFTEAIESLEHVLELDPDHSTALIHLARLRAYQGDREGVADVARRFTALNPDPARTLEVEALRAYGTGDAELVDDVERRLPAAGDLAVSLVVWAASVYCRDVASGERVTREMVSGHRGPEARRLGRGWLASFAVGRGRWTEAAAHLDSLAAWSPGTSLEWEAILHTMPFAPVTEEELRGLVMRLEALDPAAVATSDNPSIVFTAHDPIHPLIRSYQLGLALARLGDAEAARAQADLMARMELPPTAGSLGADLASGVRAVALRKAGRPEEALAELRGARVDAWYGQTMSSPLFARVHERFLRAELLLELGRPDEAARWYETIGQLSPFEVPYVAVSHLRLARIAEEAGDPEGARDHRAVFDELWASADPQARAAVGL